MKKGFKLNIRIARPEAGLKHRKLLTYSSTKLYLLSFCQQIFQFKKAQYTWLSMK